MRCAEFLLFQLFAGAAVLRRVRYLDGEKHVLRMQVRHVQCGTAVGPNGQLAAATVDGEQFRYGFVAVDSVCLRVEKEVFKKTEIVYKLLFENQVTEVPNQSTHHMRNFPHANIHVEQGVQ